jgi:alpha-N-arabinofuranosidase
VWNRARSGDATNGHEKEAPHALEEVYNLEDALLVGGMINTLLRNADRVKIACLAQLINVIAPIMTNANGLYEQTIYYPYRWALQFAKGAVLNPVVESPTYDVPGMEAVPYLDAVSTYDKEAGKIAVFLFNRDLAKSHQVEIVWEDLTPSSVASAVVLTGDDLKAVNSFDAPKNVTSRTLDSPTTSAGRTRFEVPAKSYSVLQWSL